MERAEAMQFDAVLLGLFALKLGIHLVSIGGFAYGLMGDELYYLACSRTLELGYVDHPSLSILVLRAVTTLGGDSLPAIRWVPVLTGLLAMTATVDLTRLMGGGRAAQRLTALGFALAPVYLSLHGYYSMNAFDTLFWALAVNLLYRWGRPAAWGLGLVLALGLANKLSVLWLGCGIGVVFLVTPNRLRRADPWIAAGIGLTGLLPYLFWQFGHDWITLDFIRGGSEDKLDAVGPVKFLASQVLIQGPHNLLLWASGLAALCFAPWMKNRAGAWIWLTTAALLLWHGHVRAYYLAGAFPALYAAGGVALERWLSPRWTLGYAALLLGVGLALTPMALPLLPVETYLAYEAAVGLTAPKEQNSARSTALPLHFAAKLSGPPIARAVATAWSTLSSAERARASIVSQTYTEAASIDYYGPALGLPRSRGLHNHYWLQGPGDLGGAVLIPADKEDAILTDFERCEMGSQLDCAYCPGHISRTVWVCHDLKSAPEAWWSERRRIE